jgi:hypothetical protein
VPFDTLHARSWEPNIVALMPNSSAAESPIIVRRPHDAPSRVNRAEIVVQRGPIGTCEGVVRLLLQQAAVVHPVVEPVGPMIHGAIAGVHAEAVTAAAVHMHLDGHPGFAERQI